MQLGREEAVPFRPKTMEEHERVLAHNIIQGQKLLSMEKTWQRYMNSFTY
jgi:hypothetical protein